MLGDMKFVESSLTGYLAKNLEPLTEADPLILAEYVATLLKKDKPTEELQKLCTDNLVDFLGHDTKPFIAKLFQALEDGSIVAPSECLDTTKQIESSQAVSPVDSVVRKSLFPKSEKLSPSPVHVNDPEEKEVTDDDDDDRNHKHRRRETQSLSSDKDAQEPIFVVANRKQDKPCENGQLFLGNNPQFSEIRKGYHSLESAKVEKRRPGLGALPWPVMDAGQRSRVSQAFHSDNGPRFDLSTTLGRLPSRGRGRITGPWNQHDVRFGSVDTFDFASQMVSQGTTPPSLFAGRGLANAAGTPNASWGAFGLVHGMPNGGLDMLHPLSLQGTIRPPINASINIAMPRQRCRDFEERGFCLRGDMCPMEHGVNRIVVEDVQSLSQFNLPVSIPSGRLAGMQGGTGSLPAVTTTAGISTNTKGVLSKSDKPDSVSGLNGALSGSVDAGEADLYDPDQPLWNNDGPETSSALQRLPSPKNDNTEAPWDADNFGLADGNDVERPGKTIGGTVSSHSTTSSVWGRIGNSRNKLERQGAVSSTSCLGNEMKEDQDETLTSIHGTVSHGKRNVPEDAGPRVTKFSSNPRLRTDSACNVGWTPPKALCTLFVNGIPLKNNKREALLSHFQKFGDVIDIYIPLKSERAFVQFSKREEAEAAFKAPDAVMGNRFIKLRWANRDSIPDKSVSSGSLVLATSQGVMAASVSLQSSVDRGKENFPSAAPKVSIAPFDAPIPTAVIPKPVAADSPKSVPPLQKKLDSLELLKEELRKKQEMLDQKRNDFRRQLDKLEKHAVNVKSEVVSEHAVKRHKVDMTTAVTKVGSPKPINPATPGQQAEVEKTLDKIHSGEKIVSPSSKTNSTMLQQSPRSLKQSNRLPAAIGSPFLVNRFKLDNRPTAFRILPPLPADLANVAALEDQFSSFGDLSTVELEEAEVNAGSVGPKASQNFSALITFTTRRSAERAFVNGKCWQGHNLHFTWLSNSNNSPSDNGSREHSPVVTPKGPPDAAVVAETVTSGPSSSSSGKSTCSGATGNREVENVENVKCGDLGLPKEPVETCPSKSSTRSSIEKQPPKVDVMNIDDGLNVSVHSEVK